MPVTLSSDTGTNSGALKQPKRYFWCRISMYNLNTSVCTMSTLNKSRNIYT